METRRLGDCIPNPDTIRAMESSYRRGYHHAITNAIDAFQDGVPMSTILHWEELVTQWRENRIEQFEPPTLQQAKQSLLELDQE